MEPSYEEICKVIGDLYLKNYYANLKAEKQDKSIRDLTQENAVLKAELMQKSK